MFMEEREPALSITSPEESCGISSSFLSIWFRSRDVLKRALALTHETYIKGRLSQGENVEVDTNFRTGH